MPAETNRTKGDLLALPASLFDFAADDVLFVETLSSPPEVSTSNCSGDTRFSFSSPSTDSHRNTPAGIVIGSHGPGTRRPSVVDFPTSFAPMVSFHDQFDLSSLHHFSSYEDNAAGPDIGYMPGSAAISLDSSSPMPCVFGPPFDVEVECLHPFVDFVQAATLVPSLPSGLSSMVASDQARAFAVGSMQMNSAETGMMATESETGAERVGEVFSAESVRRVYGAGDTQGFHENQLVGSGCRTTLTSDGPALEESGFKVGRYSVEERKQRIHRYMKKRNERNFNKKIKYACRKTLADSRPRVRGRFAKNDDYSDTTISNRRRHYEDDDEVDNAEYKEQELIDSSDIFAHISGVNSFNTNHPIQSWI